MSFFARLGPLLKGLASLLASHCGTSCYFELLKAAITDMRTSSSSRIERASRVVLGSCYLLFSFEVALLQSGEVKPRIAERTIKCIKSGYVIVLVPLVFDFVLIDSRNSIEPNDAAVTRKDLIQCPEHKSIHGIIRNVLHVIFYFLNSREVKRHFYHYIEID